MRIAMWSGPRNLSTAMMYSFGARADFAVVDEPFYAAYLDRTGLQHPMRDEVIASQATNPDEVVRDLLGQIPDGKPHFYQKHMTQHMISEFPRDWIDQVINVFLIRHPARVVASFSASYDQATADDLGFRQQAELFHQLCEQGQAPVVINSADIRHDPETKLQDLCVALDLPWDPVMLSWPSGGHPADGVWSPVWYKSLHISTGFSGPEGPMPELSEAAKAMVNQLMPYYAELSQHVI